MKKLLPIANALALVVVIIINYLSNTGIFNNSTMSTVSAAYSNAFTPAGYAFSIWGLIYLGLLGFVIFTGRSLFSQRQPDPYLEKIGWWFVLSCVANVLWIITWLYDYTGISVLVMMLLLGCLLKIIVNTRMELDYHPLRRYLFIFWPFAIYAGWVSIALIANIAAWLTKINWNGWGMSEVMWTVIFVVIAGLINVYMILRRNLREYAAAGIWGLVAVAVANTQDGGSTAIITACYIVAGILLLTMGFSGMKSKERSIERM